MRRCAILITALVLTGCDKPAPVVTVSDTFCTLTTRYHASDAQKAAFAKDQSTWQPLVDWLYGFALVRDKRCGPA